MRAEEQRQQRRSGPNVHASWIKASQTVDEVGFHELSFCHGGRVVVPHGSNLHVSCGMWGLAEVLGNRGVVVGQSHGSQVFCKSFPQGPVCLSHVKLVAEAAGDGIDNVRGQASEGGVDLGPAIVMDGLMYVQQGHLLSLQGWLPGGLPLGSLTVAVTSRSLRLESRL